jgi:hypothetical protein
MVGGIAPGTARTPIPGTIELSVHGDRIVTIHVPVTRNLSSTGSVGELRGCSDNSANPRREHQRQVCDRVVCSCTPTHHRHGRKNNEHSSDLHRAIVLVLPLLASTGRGIPVVLCMVAPRPGSDWGHPRPRSRTQSTAGSSTTPGGSVPVAVSQPMAAMRALTILARPSPMPAAAAQSRASGHENRGLVGSKRVAGAVFLRTA